MSAKEGFVAYMERHLNADTDGRIVRDKGWCLAIYQRPDRRVAQTEYMEEDAARELSKQLNAQFAK